MKSLNKLLTVTAFSAVFCSVLANDKPCDSMQIMPVTNEFHFISPGFAWINIADFNNSLAAFKLSPFPQQAWMLSLGSHTERGRWISECIGTVRIWGDDLDSIYRTSLCIGDFGCYSGVNVLPKNLPVNAYPYIGLHAGFSALHIRDNEKTLSGLLTSVEPNSVLWQATGLFDLGLGSEFKFSDNKGGCAIGLRIGYLFDLHKNKRWMSDGVNVADLPAITQSGPYIRLVLGGWDNHHDKKRACCSDSL